MITITDNRLVASRTFDIFSERGKNISKQKSAIDMHWQVANGSGIPVGYLIFVNDIKMEIIAAEKSTDGSVMSITGNFKLQKLLFIKKWPSSREQARCGESQGKYLSKKSFMDSQWTVNVEIEAGSSSRLLLCSVILNCFLHP
jgi:hypothetical protein